MILDDLNVGRWLWRHLKVESTSGNGEAPFRLKNLPNGNRAAGSAPVQVVEILAVHQVALHHAKVLLILANGEARDPWRQQSDLTEVHPELLNLS